MIDQQGAVLVAHTSDDFASDTIQKLTEMNYRVVGPFQSAAMALAVAAQTPVSFAVVGERLDGQRDGQQLAAALERTWGVSSVVIPEGGAFDGVPPPLLA